MSVNSPLQENAARFKEMIVKVAAAARPPISDVNKWFSECKIKIALGYLCGTAASWHNEVKDSLIYWDRETCLDKNLDSLKDAIQGACKIEAEEYYNKKSGRDKAYNDEQDPELTIITVTTVIPQVYVNHATTPTQILHHLRDNNHINVVDEQDKNVDKNEAFTASAIRNQLYITQRPSHYRKIALMSINEGSCPNQASEIMSAMAMSSKNSQITTASIMPASIMPAPVMPVLAAPIPVNPLQVLHRKRGPSVVDNQELYNIAQDLLNIKANNSETIDIEVMIVQASTITRPTATHCHVRIKENPIVAVLDLGDAVSIMLNKMAKKLQLKINESFITIIIIMNEARGKFVEIPMFYKVKILPAPLAVKVKSEKFQKLDYQDPFDNFEFDDKDLDEAKGFLNDQCSELELYDNLWLNYKSFAVYLSGVKGVSVEETEGEEKSVIHKLKKNLDDEALINN
ncbi:8925_t:CDS:2 [Cetraspora pellucida]|uniref:8925_t:CDS:1 n=1 Tax=Cetraspora pellucida TaxID=1433469 RepID=A0ACA9KML9_9GLOM|nr:8925_t:CDS:2 [Cetraspora pellucida]